MFQIFTHGGHSADVPANWHPWGGLYYTPEAAAAAYSRWYRSLSRPHTVCGYNSCSQVMLVAVPA